MDKWCVFSRNEQHVVIVYMDKLDVVHSDTDYFHLVPVRL